MPDDRTSAEGDEASADRLLVCGICGKPVESLHVARDTETVDVPRFLRRHGRCLTKSATGRLPAHRR